MSATPGVAGCARAGRRVVSGGEEVFGPVVSALTYDSVDEAFDALLTDVAL